MNAPKLDKRLRAVVDNIDGDTLADIGCDHGKVAVCALLEKRSENAIACDISEKSLGKAVELAKAYGLTNISFRVGDGFGPLDNNEADCAVIAGMGGREIMSILGDRKGIKKFVLVAHKNSIELRDFLSLNNLYIQKDFKVEQSGKFYDVIVAVDGEGMDCRLDEKSRYIGCNDMNNADFAEYIDLLKIKYKRLEAYGERSEEGMTIATVLKLAKESSQAI